MSVAKLKIDAGSALALSGIRDALAAKPPDVQESRVKVSGYYRHEVEADQRIDVFTLDKAREDYENDQANAIRIVAALFDHFGEAVGPWLIALTRKLLEHPSTDAETIGQHSFVNCIALGMYLQRRLDRVE